LLVIDRVQNEISSTAQEKMANFLLLGFGRFLARYVPASHYKLTINVSVVYIGRDVVIWMRATSITRGVIRVGH